MEDTNVKDVKFWRWVALFGVIAVLVFVFWLISWALITWKLGNPTDPGGFGDMFGAVNALFSGLAFAGVILAILMQRKELEFQRKELALSTKAQEAQERALVITAQLNANTALLQNSATVHDAEEDVGMYDPVSHREWAIGCVNEIARLLKELRELSDRP